MSKSEAACSLKHSSFSVRFINKITLKTFYRPLLRSKPWVILLRLE